MGMSKSVFSITNLVWKTRELGGYGVSGRSQQQIRYKFESTQYKKYHPVGTAWPEFLEVKR